MQFVNPSHHLKVGHRHRPRQVVDAAAADAQNLRLLCDRQIVLTVDHRFALSRPALLSAPSKKSFSSASSPIFACSDLLDVRPFVSGTTNICLSEVGVSPPIAVHHLN